MKYKIEEIGASFTQKWIDELETKLNESAESWYKFHSVIKVEKPWCLWTKSWSSTTYLAIFENQSR